MVIESPLVHLVFLSLAIFFNVSHNLLLKLSSPDSLPMLHKYGFIAAALGLGAFGAYFFARSLERIQLSLAYPAFSGSSVVLTCVLALVLFRDSLSLPGLIGIVLIMIGVSLVGTSLNPQS